MTRKIVGGVVVIIVIIGGWFLLSSTPAKAPTTITQTPVTTTPTTSSTTTVTTTTTVSKTGVTILYSDQGFSPSSITLPLGSTVMFVNQSTKNMWVASAMHPTHIVYSGTSLSEHCPDTNNSTFDQCVAVTQGNTFSFTFNKEGIWKYHNHTSSGDRGTITIIAATSI